MLEDYRNFLLEVGNGGAGSGSGLLGIGYESEISETLNEESDEFLAQPFLLNVGWNDLNLMVKNENDYFDYKFIQSTITIAHYGCGMFAKLVMTGEQRGNIWMDDRSNDGGIYPFERNICYFLHESKQDNVNEDEDMQQPLCFYDCYDEWLNRMSAVQNYYSSP